RSSPSPDLKLDTAYLVTTSQQPSASARQCSCLNPPVTPVSISSAYWEAGDPAAAAEVAELSHWLELETAVHRGSHIIKWTQRVCIESKVLEPNTREQLFMPFRDGRHGVTWDTCFCTRSCRQTGVKGDRMPQCPPDARRCTAPACCRGWTPASWTPACWTRGQRHCLLPSLRPGQLYIVSLQAVTEFGDSQPRIMRFLTPADGGQSSTRPAAAGASSA
uniref:Fibronectin type-III domain-containing protein n=1 Tax=Macrostomum lignano TaxID=282301 RepID=A0A1I8FB83_9PLAT